MLPPPALSGLFPRGGSTPGARPVLIALDAALEGVVQQQLHEQLAALPTAASARAALDGGASVLAQDLLTAISLWDRLAPEHLALHLKRAREVAPRLTHCGVLFIGSAAAEVLGDYGAGPNHTLPTGGTARYAGGLSIHAFHRLRTWLRVDDLAATQELVSDAVALAREEGLEAHARSAGLRRTVCKK